MWGGLQKSLAGRHFCWGELRGQVLTWGFPRAGSPGVQGPQISHLQNVSSHTASRGTPRPCVVDEGRACPEHTARTCAWEGPAHRPAPAPQVWEDLSLLLLGVAPSNSLPLNSTPDLGFLPEPGCLSRSLPASFRPSPPLTYNGPGYASGSLSHTHISRCSLVPGTPRGQARQGGLCSPMRPVSLCAAGVGLASSCCSPRCTGVGSPSRPEAGHPAVRMATRRDGY